MINYSVNTRHHIIGAGVQAHGGMWPSSASNWWEAGGATGAVAVYQPKGAASYAASLVNLANPGTYDATEGVAPAWGAGTGWTFNGSTQYLTTGVVPVSGYSWAVRFANAAKNDSYIFGESHGAYPSARMSLRYETGRVGYENGGAYTYGSAYTAGIAAATTVGYKGGVADTAMLAAWSGSTIQDVYIGCRNGAGTAIGFAAVDVLAIAIYNTTLTPEQVAAVSAAMAAL